MTTLVSRPAIDQWPDLLRVPSGTRATVSAYVARRLFEAGVRQLPVTVHLDGRTLGRGGPEMSVHRPDEFFARLGRGALIGFGEAYLTGAWDAPDLGAFLAVLAGELPRLVPDSLQRLRALATVRPPRHERSTVTNSKQNIAHHYDLSNDLFELFLDQTLAYSAALFEGAEVALPEHSRMTEPAVGGDLPAAQGRKFERLLDRTGVGEGTRVLEIGTGWGELAIRAARRGAVVHSITLSTEQRALAEQRIRAAGYADRVDVELLDYRDLPRDTTYDAVLSVEMIEAVGYDFWEEYFAILDGVTAAGSACRRSRCRTTGCSRRGGPTPGSTSTSFPGASCRRSRRSSGCPPGGPASASPTGSRSAPTTPRPCGSGTSGSWPSVTGSWRSASTRPSCGCGTSTWSTRVPGSPRGTSTSTRSC